MSTVYGIHDLELNPGVKPEELERFMLEEFMPAMARAPGLKVRLLRGDRGARAGRYALMYEIESEAARDGFVSDAGERTEALYRAVPALDALTERANALGPSSYTDYVAVTE